MKKTDALHRVETLHTKFRTYRSHGRALLGAIRELISITAHDAYGEKDYLRLLVQLQSAFSALENEHHKLLDNVVVFYVQSIGVGRSILGVTDPAVTYPALYNMLVVEALNAPQYPVIKASLEALKTEDCAKAIELLQEEMRTANAPLHYRACLNVTRALVECILNDMPTTRVQFCNSLFGALHMVNSQAARVELASEFKRMCNGR